MTLKIPSIDDRRYQDLLDDALARIAVHNPEWTNFNKSDPGVTILEVFAFLTEILLFKANQIPDRNRLKFLSLLGVRPRPMRSALGLVTFDRGPLEPLLCPANTEVFSNGVPFRTARSVEVLPVEARVYGKRSQIINEVQRRYYQRLYQSFGEPNLSMYETVPLDAQTPLGFSDTVDGSLWVALLRRETDKNTPLENVAEQMSNRILSLGMVPVLEHAERRIGPAQIGQQQTDLLRFSVPEVPSGGKPAQAPLYQRLSARATLDVLLEPGVIELELPARVSTWRNIDPLESGVGDLPPALDPELEARVVTWVRIVAQGSVQAKFLWVGINAAMVEQRAEVIGEAIGEGNGQPDQVMRLVHTPVIPGSVQVTVTAPIPASMTRTTQIDTQTDVWLEIDDLMAAPSEVPIADPSLPPGSARAQNVTKNRVFMLDPSTGELRFGDGSHGRRPAFAATLRARYAYGVGAAGNVATGAISAVPQQGQLRVSNPVRTWGGADAQSTPEAEKGITRYLQHRDRLVTSRDFEMIVWQTPGIDLGRIEVLPAFDPNGTGGELGNAPGAVTLLLIPRSDPNQPDAPLPDRLFLDTVCDYLEPRRLVTTEVFLRGPTYHEIQVSVGIVSEEGVNAAEVRERVKLAVRAFLSPLPNEIPDLFHDLESITGLPARTNDRAGRDGWPLKLPVSALELMAVVNRVPGVQLTKPVLLGDRNGGRVDEVRLNGPLELPRLTALECVIGDPVPLEELQARSESGNTGRVLPAPTIADACK